MICEACKNIFRGGLQFSEGVEPGSLVSDGRVHQVSKDSLLQATREHCQICTLVWRKISHDGQMATPHRSLSFTKYRFHDRSNVRTLGFFQSLEEGVDDELLYPIFWVYLDPLKGLLHS